MRKGKGDGRIGKEERSRSDMGRPKKYTVMLTEDEINSLKKEMKKQGVCKTVQKRCQILLDLDESGG